MNTITLAEFDALKSIADIRTALFADNTYTELTESTDGAHGQVKRVTVTKNLLTDEVVETQTVDWSYYGTGDVNEITTSKTDKADKPVGKAQVVKHFTDGTQPTVSAQAVKP